MLPQLAKSPYAMFALFSVGFAAIRMEDIPNGILPAKRQLQGTGSSSSSSSSVSSTPIDTSSSSSSSSTPPTTSSSPPPTTTSSSVSIPITSTNSDGSTTTSHIPVSTSSSTSDFVSTESGKSGTLVVVGSTTINPTTLHTPTTVTSHFTTSATVHSSFTSTWTTDGSTFSSVIETDQVVASTGVATATISPALANQGGSGANLSSSSKKIIGGVVGGIGGAALIGGIALVAWRLWGKKKRQTVDHDEYLDSQPDSIRHEKRVSNGQPFVSNQYHNPNGAVNTASNF